MKKPDKNLLMLYSLGFIKSITINYKQTGNDTADTFCEIKGNIKSVKGLWKTYEQYLNVRVNHNSIAEVHKAYQNDCEEWFKFERENEEELKEYERLKAKFD